MQPVKSNYMNAYLDVQLVSTISPTLTAPLTSAFDDSFLLAHVVVAWNWTQNLH